MKGATVPCLTCNKLFIKRRDSHKFCRTACRVANHRKRHGISSPFDIKARNISSPLPPEPPIQRKPVYQDVPNMPSVPIGKQIVTPANMRLRPIANEMVKLQQEMLYWQRVIEDAHRGVFPIATLGLATAGASMGKDGFSKLALGLVGAWFGNSIDKSRAQTKESRMIQVVDNAQRHIGHIKSKIGALKTMEKEVKRLTNKGLFKSLPESNNLALGDIITGEAYRNKNIPTLGFGDKWNVLIGDPAPGFSMLFSGLPGNGKSTTAIEFSQYFQNNHGRVLFVASEQKGVNKPLQELLERFRATFDIWTKPSSKLDKISSKIPGYDLVVIDSVNHLGLSPEEVEELKEKFPKTSFVLVMQSTKDGKLRGSQKFLHNCDINVEMKNFVAHQTKSRFAPPMEVPMF